jgi:hypothetical protein
MIAVKAPVPIPPFPRRRNNVWEVGFSPLIRPFGFHLAMSHCGPFEVEPKGSEALGEM